MAKPKKPEKPKRDEEREDRISMQINVTVPKGPTTA